MSDYRERACFECGSYLHHEDDCPARHARFRTLAEKFTYRIEWSEADNAFVSSVEEWPSLKAHGSSPQDALIALVHVVAWTITECQKEGDEHPLPSFLMEQQDGQVENEQGS